MTLSSPLANQTNLLHILNTQLRQHRRQVMTFRLLYKLPILLLLLALTYFFTTSIFAVCLFALVLFCLLIWQMIRSVEVANINLDNYLLHLNRRYPQLQESAQLLNRDTQSLNALQRLQQQKICELLPTLLNQQQAITQQDYALKRPVLLNTFGLIMIAVVYGLTTQVNWPFHSELRPFENPIEAERASVLPEAISWVQVTITPPAYSNLGPSQSDTLNLTLLAGSLVQWQLGFKSSAQMTSSKQSEYRMHFSNGETLPLVTDEQGNVSASRVVTRSTIYTLSASEIKIDGVFTLSVTADSAPKIRFVSPSSTTTEIPKDGLAELLTEVVVSDDFALSQVNIQASIAKGSGEGVKFRDQTFEFDSMTVMDGQAHYFKHWKLSELGMEPGDEMYFSVLALDNRKPEAQLTRSPSKIVRWLEEEQSELATDGILLDVMTEYFKSQRQIIIETEQLLVDEPQLAVKEFKRISTDLGFAQSDLKQKYGQFVGDEFEGATLHSMESGPVHQAQHHDDEDDDGESHQDTSDSEAHQHQPEPRLTEDKSGASDLIAQYGHNHGEAELGFTGFKGQPSPTALMKQAIANMWNAELHLMMAEPALALPYEKQALKFLTQAKQAERIYVKRLGFEPPPVSESRRYQGELKSINNAKQTLLSPPPSTQSQLLIHSISALESWRTNKQLEIQAELNTAQLQQLNALLSENLSQSPENIQHIASIEKLKFNANQLKRECPECIKALQQTLWQLLPPLVAAPAIRQPGYLLNNSAINTYQQFLQQESQP